jgi:diketogulonate reductase-like aldo/keto reductase
VSQIQSKFTPLWAHDKDKIPFDPNQGIEGQIRESVQQSLAHLKVDYLNAFLLHAPYEDENDNLIAWRVLESFVPHQIRCLGVSNFSLPQLRKVYESSIVKPVIVQNRFFQDTGYDIELRAFCADHGILYQAFWMLKANSEILESDLLSSVAEKLGVEKELAFYILILGLGGTRILDGTTKSDRMVRDLQTVAEVFGNGQLRPDLQGSVQEFRQILWKLASRKSPA